MLIVSVEVALAPGVRLTLVGLRLAVSPVAVGEAVADSDTLPVNPRLPTVIVDVADPPARTLAVVGLAAIVKSEVTVRATVPELVVVPLVPVTVTV